MEVVGKIVSLRIEKHSTDSIWIEVLILQCY